LVAALAGIGFAAVVLVNVLRGGCGMIWPRFAVLFIARRWFCYPGASGRIGQDD
jgi:hypothetical protein